MRGGHSRCGCRPAWTACVLAALLVPVAPVGAGQQPATAPAADPLIQQRIARRFTNPAHTGFIARLNDDQARTLLRWTYETIRDHGFREIPVAQLAAAGTRHMRLALGSREFLRANGLTPTRAEAERARRDLADAERDFRTAAWTEPQAVAKAADLAQRLKRTLGVPGPVVLTLFAAAACEEVDAHSELLDPTALQDAQALIQGRFVGIGVELKEQDDQVVLVRLVPGGPAEAAGLRPGDVLTAIDGVEVRGWRLEQVAARLLGPAGQPVRLTVTRPRRPDSLTRVIKRAEIVLPSVRTVRMLDRQAGIGYIHLAGFQEDTAEETESALERLKSQGLRALVLDLRGNPGGLFSAAVRVADLFVDQGILVSTRGRSIAQTWTHRAHPTGRTGRGLPLVVIVGPDTASAAEIVASAIRDNRRGLMIGQPTFGKGSVQTLFDLPALAAGLRLTTALYYTPTGQPIGPAGLQPDVVIPLASDSSVGYTSTGSGNGPDNQLRTAVTLLRGQI